MKGADADNADQDERPKPRRGRKPRRPSGRAARQTVSADVPSPPDSSSVSPAGPTPAAGCFHLVSAPDGIRPTTPMLAGSNPVGAVLLSTGIASLAGPALKPVMPLLPVTAAGFDVHEGLHRISVDVRPPTIDTGLRASNAVGESLATIDMRWLVAPDDFVVAPGATPPATRLDPSRSQRVAMLDGALMFREASATGVRFFGAGRTFPAPDRKSPRVPFAGTATILEGLGMLKGVTGTMLVTGYVTPRGDLSLSVVARLDHAALPGDDSGHRPLRPGGRPDSQTALLTLSGESSAPADLHVSPAVGVSADQILERLSAVHLENDAPEITWLRSSVRQGAAVGRVSGPLHFDPTDTAYAGRLRGTTRRFTFVDASGYLIGSAKADILEGTAFRDAADDQSRYRLTGFGALTDGTGVLEGIGGVVAIDMLVSPASGRVSSTYSLRLGDPDGRFGPLQAPAPPPGAGAQPGAPVDAVCGMRFVAGEGAPAVTADDRALLAHVERTVNEGHELRRWWVEKDKAGDFADRFEIVRQYNPGDHTFGFYDTATVGGKSVPVMGVVQEMFYDLQKQATAEQIRPQLREFILRYFMRVSHSRAPEVAPAPSTAPAVLRPLSWLPDEVEHRVGFGYRQLFYKRQDGLVGKFPAEDDRAIVDLRGIGPTYDWLVVKVSIYDFALAFAPIGGNGPRLEYPLKEETYLALSPEFIVEREHPEPGVLAEYGFGYSFVPYLPEPDMLAYGPGHFSNAVKSIVFRLHDDGRIHVRAAFVVNRPKKIANIDIDPVEWSLEMADRMTFHLASGAMAPMKDLAARLPLRLKGVDPIGGYVWLANMLTIGMAGRQLGITTEQLEKRMMVQHFMQHYQLLVNSLTVWRQIGDWTDAEHLPEFCRRGVAV